MAAIVGGLCTESLWGGYRFAMNDIKKSKNISDEAYLQSSNANARVLLNLSIFWLVLIIPGELVKDFGFACTQAHIIHAAKTGAGHNTHTEQHYGRLHVRLNICSLLRDLLSSADTLPFCQIHKVTFKHKSNLVTEMVKIQFTYTGYYGTCNVQTYVATIYCNSFSTASLAPSSIIYGYTDAHTLN